MRFQKKVPTPAQKPFVERTLRPPPRLIPYREPEPGRQEFHSRRLVRPRKIFDETFPWKPQSGSKLRLMGWPRLVAYTNASHEAFSAHMLERGFRKAHECPPYFALVRFTTITHRSKYMDDDNLAYGLKAFRDMLTWRHPRGWGIIADDCPTWGDFQYHQVKTGAVPEGTHVEIYVLEWTRPVGEKYRGLTVEDMED